MPETTREDLISVRSAMDNHLAWFEQALEQPYTVAEMVENLHHFLACIFGISAIIRLRRLKNCTGFSLSKIVCGRIFSAGLECLVPDWLLRKISNMPE